MVKVTITDFMTIHDEEIDTKIFLSSPFEPSLPFIGHQQTVQNQIRHCRMRCMAQFYTVCLLNVSLNFK